MNKKRMIALFVLALIALALVAALFFANQKERDAVAKIGGKPVNRGEYYVFLYEQKMLFENIGGTDIWEINFDGETAEDVAKHNALQRIKLVRAAASQAKLMDISLTQEEKQNALLSAERLISNANASSALKYGLTIKQAANIMENIQLLNKVYERVTQNVAVSETDFADYFRQYQLDNESDISPRTAAELVEIEDVLRSSYLETKQKDVFNENYAKWATDTTTEINYKIWNNIHITDIE